MIAEAGLAAIWLAASMALLQFIAGLTLLRSGAGQLAPLIKPAAYMQGALCTFAFFALMWLFYVTDLSVLLVANNSHIDKPLIFKLAGTWGNHEGSLLLWVTILSVSGAAIAFLEKAAQVARSRPLYRQAFVLTLAEALLFVVERQSQDVGRWQQPDRVGAD